MQMRLLGAVVLSAGALLLQGCAYDSYAGYVTAGGYGYTGYYGSFGYPTYPYGYRGYAYPEYGGPVTAVVATVAGIGVAGMGENATRVSAVVNTERAGLVKKEAIVRSTSGRELDPLIQMACIGRRSLVQARFAAGSLSGILCEGSVSPASL
jgi:hypothetical protein